MTAGPVRSVDRVEEFMAAVDTYEPTRLARHEDNFRVFARFISRTLDARYLERHPSSELIRDLEFLLAAGLVREENEIKVRVTESEDAATSRGIIAVCLPDHLFILSTVLLSLENLGINRLRYLATVVPVRRGVTGEIESVGHADSLEETFIWLEVEAADLQGRRQELEDGLRERLQAVQTAVRDFKSIDSMVRALAARSSKLAHTRPDQRAAHEDNARFLRWLLNENFVFLGTRFLPIAGTKPADPVSDKGVGTFDDWRRIRLDDAERTVHEAGAIPPFLWVRKSPTESYVYRSGPLDHILVQCWDEAGAPAGLLVIEGLFSFQALAQARTEIPLLDRMIAQIFADLQASKGSHRYRTIRNAFNSLPLEYLFSLQSDDVRALIEQLLEVDAEHRLQVHITTEEHQNFVFVFVAVPRSHYTEELRIEVRRLLKRRFRASSVDDGVYAGNPNSVTFHYFLTGVNVLPEAEQQEIRAEIDQLASPWSDRLRDELAQRYEPRVARELHGLYNEAFPNRYREETSISRAVTDIELMENVHRTGQFDCDLYQEKPDRRLGITRLRMMPTESILLSDILPALDNLGLVIIDEFPTSVHVPGRTEQVISTFRIRGVQDMDVNLITRRNRLRAAIRAIVDQALDNDPINRLLLKADIPWTYVALLRAYQNYTRQIGIPYTFAKIQDALETNASVVRAITELFRAKFDPGLEGQSAYYVDERREALVERTRRALLNLLDGVQDLTSDQVLRTFYHLVEATVRTNFYARDPMTNPEVVLKLDPSRIPRMPPPLPFREIYVHHPQVAGLHLRGGPIARGGIRWSDRVLDFRTEVLSLVATQNLKNVVIVPRGAKGSFVLRKPKRSPAQRREQADQLYRIFIDGLLQVTDNLIDGEVKHPRGVLCYDGPDHYLVVAADKGTAHLSDAANGVAATHNFWLGDAFASGGSAGYDHKKEGITARGAWECVKRHFREMGVDPERDPIRVVGIGDMSGDVFGNGMLLSKSIQLVAAFDHRNIFIDPDPDPAKSYDARRGLFETPRSSWEDYPQELISEGGGVWSRASKSIRLSPQMKALLKVQEDSLSGDDLIKAVLRAPVDLLWNGGIGTYIKSSEETNLQVEDAANDSVRVDANEVRAKVIGEGGNLGITGLGRVQLGASGVRLNIDAVDNSAGVDLSDHEVNLKILFERPLSRGEFTVAKRDELMQKVRVRVNGMVLENNWIQSRMISLDRIRSQRDLPRFARAIDFLSERVPFSRRELHLPGSRILAQREESGSGLFRPELAVLAANAKLDFRQELVKSQRFGLEQLAEYLFAYFPQSVVEQFHDDIKEHPLAVHIARTVLTNQILGDAGASWLVETTVRTGRATDDILEAYLAACQLIEAPELKSTITSLESKLRADVEYDLRLIVEGAIENVTNWQLTSGAALDATLSKMFRETLSCLVENVPPRDADAIAAASVELRMRDVPQPLAERMAVLTRVGEVLDVAQLAADSGLDIPYACRAVYEVGNATGLMDVIRAATEADARGPAGGKLELPARYALRDRMRRKLVMIATALTRLESGPSVLTERTEPWIKALKTDLTPLSNGRRDLSSLVVAADRIDRHARMLQQSVFD